MGKWVKGKESALWMPLVAGLLGSEIIPSPVSSHRASKKASMILQIKVTLKGIDPPVWRRIHTPDCTLERARTALHQR